MGNKLYVGNLSYSTTDASLSNFFAQAGAVASAKIITDRETGRSKGFGFVEMENDDDAADAISKLDGADLDGRNIKVSEARPQAPRGNTGRGGSGGGPRGPKGHGSFNRGYGHRRSEEG